MAGSERPAPSQPRGPELLPLKSLLELHAAFFSNRVMLRNVTRAHLLSHVLRVSCMFHTCVIYLQRLSQRE